MREYLIWGNAPDCFDFDEWKSELPAHYLDYYDDEYLYNWMLELNDDDFNEIRFRMKRKDVGSPIVQFKVVKTKSGLKELLTHSNGNLEWCLYDLYDFKYRKWYCADGEFRFEGWNKNKETDATHYIYRKLKKDVSVSDFEKMTTKEKWEATESIYEDVRRLFYY